MAKNREDSREFDKFTDLVDRMVAPKKPDAEEPRRIPKANKRAEKPPASDQKAAKGD